jgi:hypothetical protein
VFANSAAGPKNPLSQPVTITAIISLYNNKFRSKQGMPPAFILGLKYEQQRRVYGSYTPILNNWGFTEYLGLLERTPLLFAVAP